MSLWHWWRLSEFVHGQEKKDYETLMGIVWNSVYIYEETIEFGNRISGF